MRKVALGSITIVSAGQGAPKQDEFSNNGIPFVRAGSLEDLISGKTESGLELVPIETAKKRKLKLYPKGAILFAKSGMSATKGRIYVLNNPAYVVSHLAILIPKDNIFTDYLRLALKQFPPSVLIKDLNYPAISLTEIQSYQIPVPEDLDDQKRIAHLLSKVEGLIAQRKQHLQQLDDLLKSVFLEMFGDPVRNEKGWGKKPLSKLATVKIGPFGSLLHAEDYISGGIPLVNPSHMVDGEIEIDESLTITEEKFNELAAYHLALNDVVVARRGEIGRCALVRTEYKLLCGTGSMLVRIHGEYLPLLLQFMIFNTSLRSFLENQAKGVTMKNLNSSILENMEVITPSIELQNKFAAIVQKADGIKSRYQQSLADLEKLYGALSQKAFKGELDLSRVPLPPENDSELLKEGELSIAESIDYGPARCLPVFTFPSPNNLEVFIAPEGRIKYFQLCFNKFLSQLQELPTPPPLKVLFDDIEFQLENYKEEIEGELESLEGDEYKKLSTLIEECEYRISLKDYDVLKCLLFNALEEGTLKQIYPDDMNNVQVLRTRD